MKTIFIIIGIFYLISAILMIYSFITAPTIIDDIDKLDQDKDNQDPKQLNIAKMITKVPLKP